MNHATAGNIMDGLGSYRPRRRSGQGSESGRNCRRLRSSSVGFVFEHLPERLPEDPDYVESDLE